MWAKRRRGTNFLWSISRIRLSKIWWFDHNMATLNPRLKGQSFLHAEPNFSTGCFYCSRRVSLKLKPELEIFIKNCVDIFPLSLLVFWGKNIVVNSLFDSERFYWTRFHGFFSSNWRVFPCKNSVSYFSISICLYYFVYKTHLFEVPTEFVQRKKNQNNWFVIFQTQWFFFFFNLLQDPSNIYVVSISFVWCGSKLICFYKDVLGLIQHNCNLFV